MPGQLLPWCTLSSRTIIMRRANLIISIVLISFSGFYAYLITRLPDRNLPNTLGADFMPWVLTVFFGLALHTASDQESFKKRGRRGDG